MPRAIRILLLPFLALVALVAWMFASPVGAAADDDYHLVSTWCASVTQSAEWCGDGATDRERSVPRQLVEVSCFAGEPEVSASCQDPLWADGREAVETDRGNWRGQYPPVYYAVMGVFASPDVQTSALVMRFATILLFLAMTIALYVLLPAARRPTLLWTWLISSLPLGIFLLSSNNPSSWALIGVGSSWIALLGYFESTGRRRIALGAVFALAVLIAAGARSDAALYAGFAIAVVLFLTIRRERAWLLQAILPAAMGLVALVFFLTARQSRSGLGGFSGGGSDLAAAGAGGGVEESLSGAGLLAYNVLNAPFLWSGVFGTWGLGWLDTSMPWVVPLAAIAVFVGVGFVGLARKDLRTVIAVVATGVVLWVVPVFTLQAGGHMVGDAVQPRYLFPLIVLLGGLLTLAPASRPVVLGRTQAYLVATTLAAVNLIALHMNIRRYVTGIDGASPDLDSGAEWWWVLPVGPTAVWLIGAAAFAALVFLVVPRLASGAVPERGLLGRGVPA